jgi:hypothetical protein
MVMKNFLFAFTIIFVFFSTANAQNASPYWSLAGNSNATSSSKLGTTNGTSLRFYTNNLQRMIINAAGFVGIGNASPVNILTVQSGGSTPLPGWLSGLNSPVFVGFGETVSSELLLAGASNTVSNRAVFQGRRARGTLAAPLVVRLNDYLTSLLASGYDGSTFQNPAAVNFYVDGTPSKGHVPARISFVTGTNVDDREERLRVGSTGNFSFNNDQIFLRQSDGNVGIGTTSPAARLDVKGSTTSGTGGNFTGYDFGLQAGSTSAGGYGIYGYSSNIGIYGTAASGTYGVYGYSGNIGSYGTGGSSGVYGYSNDGNGVYGSSYDGYGVNGFSTKGYAGYFTSTDNYGLVATSTNAYYAGVFYGHVYSSLGFVTSDKNLKKDIRDFGNAMTIINKLKPENYLFKDDAKYASLHLPKGRHYGLLAQDLEQVLPNLVSEAPHQLIIHPQPAAPVKPTADGKPQPIVAETKETKETINIKAVNYVELIPIIIKGMQEQQEEIENLKVINADLKNRLDQLNSLMLEGNKPTSITSNGYLKQNVPNPAANNTVISYYVADNGTAQIKLTDIKGSLLKVYNASKGNGLLNIKSGELPAGTYTYTLYVNDNLVDTKKMVITK